MNRTALLLVIALAVLSVGCATTRTHVGITGGVSKTFKDKVKRSGANLSILARFATTERLFIGALIGTELFWTMQDDWMVQMYVGLTHGVRFGPAELYLMYGYSVFNADKMLGRRGIGMYSPFVGLGLSLRVGRRLALTGQTRVHYLWRFNRKDATPMWSTSFGLTLFSEEGRVRAYKNSPRPAGPSLDLHH